eukprot:PITA_34431
MDCMVEKNMEIISQESPQLLFVDDHFVGLVKKIIIDRWNNFNTPLHTLAHALNPKFYDEELISQRNGKRKAPHKNRQVANGVIKSLMRMFPTHLHREVKEEFSSFVVGIDDYADISALDLRSTMNPKAGDLVYLHYNLHFASRRGPEYNSGSPKEWDVNAESPNLDLSLASLNIEVQPGSGIGLSSSSTPPSIVEHGSTSTFDEDYHDED